MSDEIEREIREAIESKPPRKRTTEEERLHEERKAEDAKGLEQHLAELLKKKSDTGSDAKKQ